MTGPAIELSGVEVIRGEKAILRLGRLAVEHRAFVGVVGPNGAGKTTLLSLCAALSTPTRGEARVLGLSTGCLSAWGLANLRRRIGVVPQHVDYYVDVPLTVREVVSLGRVGPRGLLRRLNARDREITGQWLHKLGLEKLADRAFRSLSGGEQQKALIARAMVQEPALLLLDEPASNLDLDWKQRLVSLLAELYRTTSVTVIMVSHETSLLPECVDQVVLMKSGEVLSTGTPGEVFTAANLSAAYGCPVEVVRLNGRFHALAACLPGASGREEDSA
jgi:ABC-type cobalamin/Fe3+-siderophores transport system ATPase subunit